MNKVMDICVASDIEPQSTVEMRVLTFVLGVLLVSGTRASETLVDNQDVPAGEQRYILGVPLTESTSAHVVEDTCTDAVIYGNVSETALAVDHAILTRVEAATVGLSRFCVGEGCGAYASGTMAAAGCVGDLCAFAAFGDWAGKQCVGVNCSAHSISGCTTTQFNANTQECNDADECENIISTAEFSSCCVGHQGSGCLLEGCAQSCVGSNCGEYVSSLFDLFKGPRPSRGPLGAAHGP